MKLFDLHCDTPYELYKKGQHLRSNDLHVSLERASVFSRYIQCAAVWSDSKKSDSECFEDFTVISESFKNEASGMMIGTSDELQKTKETGFILAVEDARLISPSIANIDTLYASGVRVMTLTWGGRTAIGSSFDSEGGLTRFGKEALLRMLEIGIIPDLSHASDDLCREALDIARKEKKPLIATHSNSRAVFDHKRNLTDSTAASIAGCGGIIGISLCPSHLTAGKASASDVIRHIEHYLSVIGSEALCLGCDLDGISDTPEGLTDISRLGHLYDGLCSRVGSSTADKIFFDNAYNFFTNNLPQKEKALL